jgi:hypothetical protein
MGHDQNKPMNRTFALILVVGMGYLLAAAADDARTKEKEASMSNGLAAPVAAQVSVEVAATRVYGMTPRRLWATTATMLALAAAVNGGLNLDIATGGHGTGNGIIGGAAALVLGLIATALGGLALARSRRTG